MPEDPEVHVHDDNLEKEIQESGQKMGKPVTGFLRIHPSMFSVGTEKRKYKTMTVHNINYIASSEPALEGSPPIDEHDLQRIKEPNYRCCEYLMGRNASGKVHHRVRGKYMAVACGHHCITISFGLESHPMLLPPAVYDEIVANSYTGQNSEPAKAELLRDFHIPDRFIVPHSQAVLKKMDHRPIRIFAAVVTPLFVWAVVDFSRLVRFHVTSIGRHWVASDLEPGSELWGVIWKPYNVGPDWRSEQSVVRPALDEWRNRILRSRSRQTITDAMANDSYAFSPFGRHLIADALHEQGIFPGMPAKLVCADDSQYTRFVDGLMNYINDLATTSFTSLLSCRMNTTNPFDFNWKADTDYGNRCVKVFRRAYVGVKVPLFNYLLKNGLLDPQHTMGTSSYILKPEHESLIVSERDRQLVMLPVWQQADLFTVIRANIPEGWYGGDAASARPVEDYRLQGYMTTIGPVNFRELKSNMVNLNDVEVLSGKPGRKPKIRTGKRGKPPKTPRVSTLRNRAHKLDKADGSIVTTQQRLLAQYSTLFPHSTGSQDETDTTPTPSDASTSKPTKRKGDLEALIAGWGEHLTTYIEPQPLSPIKMNTMTRHNSRRISV
ncbi:hypothetical protein V5O48_014533 [Marasmius crinis-equi]|uniref:RNA-dependent RNA polymerase n=1 Tax=Marasmius crinis-equi TaxID=585013 RepID=A0ABR3EX27_9AGAR